MGMTRGFASDTTDPAILYLVSEAKCCYNGKRKAARQQIRVINKRWYVIMQMIQPMQQEKQQQEKHQQQPVTRKPLGAGCHLTCVTTPKFKRAVLRVAFLLSLGGSDAANRAVLPHVLRRGTQRLPDLRAIGSVLDDLYGARIEAMVRREGETLAIGFLSDCIRETYAFDTNTLTDQTNAPKGSPDGSGILSRTNSLAKELLQLLGEFIYQPYSEEGGFSATYTAGERANLLDRIAAQKNDPRIYAPLRLTELMCQNEAYGQSVFGTTEQAQAITAQELNAAYRRVLQQARMELFYCGAMPPDEVAALFTAILPQRIAQLADGVDTDGASDTFYTPQVETQIAPPDHPRTFIEEAQVTQGKLSMGFRTGGICMTHGDLAAYSLFQTLFGGSTASKLFIHVREKNSLCYYANAQFIASKGLLIVNSGIENPNFAIARDEILHQLALCQAGDFSDTELESARQTLINSWRAILDDPLALERYWMRQAVAGTLVSPEERIEQVKEVTRERVIAAAQATRLDTVYFMKGAVAS